MRPPKPSPLDSPKKWATRSADIARPGEGGPGVDLAPELRRAELMGCSCHLPALSGSLLSAAAVWKVPQKIGARF